MKNGKAFTEVQTHEKYSGKRTKSLGKISADIQLLLVILNTSNKSD